MIPLLALLLISQWDPERADHLDELSRLLKTHTAYLEVKVTPDKSQPLAERERNGFGAVIGEKLVATSYFITEHARAVSIIGPKRVEIPGKVVLEDVERRVALIATERPLSDTGLSPAKPLEKKDRKEDADVFALVSTLELAGVVSGVITQTGSAPEAEGHPSTSLQLHLAMPVFDTELRFVGFARAVAWDRDKSLLVPPEMIKAARTATGAAAKRALEPQKDTHPWWAK